VIERTPDCGASLVPGWFPEKPAGIAARGAARPGAARQLDPSHHKLFLTVLWARLRQGSGVARRSAFGAKAAGLCPAAKGA
jgi:hypothetical protein